MTAKILATLTTVVGSLGVFLAVLSAFGVQLTQEQVEALAGLGGLVVAVAGIWLHPSIPIGPSGADMSEPDA